MSVRVPPGGTRGVRIPRFLLKFGTGMMVRRFRGGKGARTQGGVEALLLETVGARSGKPRYAFLGYLPEEDDAWLVVASAAGAKWHPAWLYNLAAQPEATVEFKNGRRIDVLAETPEGPDLAAAWERIGREAPEYPKYFTKTDREIPVVRLRRR
jgi:deazaflavin-dependent oxidoreductase (nitroreductase family)